MLANVCACLISCLILLTIAVPLSAVTVGQIDDFQDGTTMGWFVPGLSPNPPTNVSTGGPGGVGDGYLQLIASGGAGAGSRLAVLNESQWGGNYLEAGISSIRMSVNNFGPDDLQLRLLFEDFPAAPMMPPDNLALSANAVVVPAGSGWMTIVFPVTAADLVGGGLGTVQGALLDVDTIRIFHNPAPAFPGPGVGIPTVNATLGVDNIQAVPEPGAIWLLGGGLMAVAGWRQARNRN